MTLIFDLDGTLLNTIADLGMACNHALASAGYPTHAIEDYPRLVGNGVNKLIERALPDNAKTSAEATEQEVMRLRKVFIPYYNMHNTDRTRPYDGIPEALAALRQAGHRMAVASNKYQEGTDKVVDHFFPGVFDAVFGERTGVPRKPDPQIVHDIFAALYGEGTAPRNALYIGDSLVDIATARNAGLPVAACTWGFVSRDMLAAEHPDYLLDSPAQLVDICAKIEQ